VLRAVFTVGAAAGAEPAGARMAMRRDWIGPARWRAIAISKFGINNLELCSEAFRAKGLSRKLSPTKLGDGDVGRSSVSSARTICSVADPRAQGSRADARLVGWHSTM
jgi:hypothetical protein